VDSYKYLGVTLNQKVMPNEHLVLMDDKIKKFRKLILINRLQGASSNKIMYLWMVFAESIMSYGAFLFSF
jgi:hypothetical protein